ncbi:Exodeoxyribonuclease 7 large subunit [Candidatus Providencia siddallii]|uniref:Exodeoxyribonuclease 7 large subunit n=1 Tax=Candidatus Providencia siddallii TaxID=1715285 RepID=A0A0M6W7E9_9GAMM|nr:Exodeoxyribonuclease 7 large subunit [Candidatus Providencia siddallii]
MSIQQNNIIYSVTNLNQNVRQLLESNIGRVWITAEISNFSQPSSGHWYFTLKDERTQIRAAMFRGQNSKVTFNPKNGNQIVVKANVTLYEPRGDYQLIIEYMQPSGEGSLQQSFKLLKEKLKKEGFFDIKHKKSLPITVNCVGIITSVTGAALHDILNILRRRDPSLPIIIYHTSVQGELAPSQIARMIEIANIRLECDTLILGRGGGSLEDLCAFNEEIVARAIFVSKLPIISAVGHETDITISDYVADIRAPTPSAAAELVSRNQAEMLRQLKSAKQHIEIAMDYFLSNKQQNFTNLNHNLKQHHPELHLTKQQNQLNLLEQKLTHLMTQKMQVYSTKFKKNENDLLQNNLLDILQKHKHHIILIKHSLQNTIIVLMKKHQQCFMIYCSKLETTSPLATIIRGFSVTTLPNGTILKKINQVKLGMQLQTRISNGWIKSKIISINNKI